MKKEESQIKNVHDIKVSKIGFVSVNGYESTPKDYVCINGEELYSIQS